MKLAETSLGHLLSFVTAVDAGNISQAARVLRIPRTSVSRHIKQLETTLGTVLLQKTTRKQKLTTAGQLVYDQAKTLLVDLQQLEDKLDAMNTKVSGQIRITTPPAFREPMVAILGKARNLYPNLSVEIVSTAKYLDFVDEDIDLAFRAGPLQDSDLHQTKVFDSQWSVFGSKDYFRRFGIPKTAKELRSHSIIIGTTDGSNPQNYWPTYSGTRVAIKSSIVANDLGLRIRLAEDGQGLIFAPDLLVTEALRTRRLVPVLKDAIGTKSSFYIVYSRKPNFAVQSFIDLAKQELSCLLRDPSLIGRAVGL